MSVSPKALKASDSLRVDALPVVQALWDSAHMLVQDDKSAVAAWVHAHIHRVESDLRNALYWYNRAGIGLMGIV